MASRRWTDFALGELPPEYPAAPGERVWLNNLYQVYERTLYEKDRLIWVHLSIKRRDRDIVHDWRDLQRIKNEIVGDEAEGVELYPAESRLVDGANQYHMWCVKGGRFPFGFPSRVVSEGSIRGSVQRPWLDDEKPPDLLDAATANAMVTDYMQKKRGVDVWHVLDILTRACEAGAYTGKTSPAVTQARQWLNDNKREINR